LKLVATEVDRVANLDGKSSSEEMLGLTALGGKEEGKAVTADDFGGFCGIAPPVRDQGRVIKHSVYCKLPPGGRD
jgi:hypothetical protein